MASLLYGLAGKLLGELGSPVLQDYVGKPWVLGTKAEFQKLRSTVSAIESVLIDAERKQSTNHQVRDWLIKIKLVFYDLEDLLLEVTTEALKRRVMTKNKKAKKVHIFFSSSNQFKFRLKMGRKVKLIREQLEAIASDCNGFNFAHVQEEMPTNKSRRREETHSFVPIDKFVGREADKQHVTKLLLQSDGVDNNVSVVSIVGIGGLGKTTLAQSVYGSEDVKGAKFELMMWVCVSDPFDVKLICEKIIESATKRKCEQVQMDGVKDELKKAIDGRKYLLVLDDVWNESPDEWMKLEMLLTGGAKGSKILITARAELVARTAKSFATHVLKGLSLEESWALFKQVAFKQGVEPKSSTIVAIGKEVAERCVGVPLAIKMAGSMLGLKERKTDWFDFKKNVLPLIAQDSEGKIVPILKLSYDHLSAPLKRCFAYCAIFPKDCNIWKDTLIKMWMAHGLIQLDGTQRSLEDVGEQHFMDLLDRSLLEVNEQNIHSFKMHDLIHDLALSIGGHEFWSSGTDVNCIDMKMTRHAWVSSAGPCISTKFLHAKKVRTFVVRKSFRKHKDEDVVIIGDFEQLRVLDLASLGVARVPHFVDELQFLTYLDLSGNDFHLLPESVGSLYNLQTLILTNCPNLKELPKGTMNLVSLRVLKISICGKLSHMPRGLGELTSLVTLSDFVMGLEGTICSELGELGSLVNLRGQLIIRNLGGLKVEKCKSSSQSSYSTPLAHLQFMQGLLLNWRDEDEVDKEEEEEDEELESLKPHPNLEKLSLHDYGGKRFPSWMERANIRVSLPNIVYIHLASCKGWRHLPPLGLLPSLRELRLWDMSDLQYSYDKKDDEWNNNNRYFPALEKLELWKCPMLEIADGRHFMGLTGLREVSLSSDMHTLPLWLQSLPHLQTLELTRCMNMVTLPEWMGNLTSLNEIRLKCCFSIASIPDCVQNLVSLQRLEVHHCRELYRKYNKESGEEWHKIALIPNVSMKDW